MNLKLGFNIYKANFKNENKGIGSETIFTSAFLTEIKKEETSKEQSTRVYDLPN